MRNPEALWVTGVGVATALGCDFETVGRNLIEGRSGIDRVKSFDVSQHPSQVAGALERVPCPPGWEPAAFAARPRREQLALWCCQRALADAGLWERRDAVRVGLVLGCGSEWLFGWEEDADPARDRPPPVEAVKQELGLSGPTLTISTACASGNFALAQARRWLELGFADVVLAGAADMGVTPMTLAGFGNLRALTRQNDRPQQASRPFDRGRDGFVLAEGGAVFVLERASDARRRGARAYAELAGCGLSSDAYHPVIPCPEPEQAAAAIRRALADARIDPADVDYVNAHGTSTPVGDAAEAKALRAVFGPAAARVPVSSTKSMTGHLLTAASAVEALACMAAFAYSAIPPTINLDDPDPECELCHVAHQARPQPVRVAVSNSFGFGGSNSCVVLRAV